MESLFVSGDAKNPTLAFSPVREQFSRQMVAETTAEPKKTRAALIRVPLPQIAMARRLYVVDQLSFREIAEQTGINRKTLENIAYRRRWIESKRGAAKRVEVKSDARIREEVEEIVSAVAIQTEELSLGTLSKARVTLDRDDVNAARDLQAYSQAAKNFVGIARQARGLDAERNAERTNGSTIIFIGALERVGDSRRSEINVTPKQAAIEIPPALPESK